MMEPPMKIQRSLFPMNGCRADGEQHCADAVDQIERPLHEAGALWCAAGGDPAKIVR